MATSTTGFHDGSRRLVASRAASSAVRQRSGAKAARIACRSSRTARVLETLRSIHLLVGEAPTPTRTPWRLEPLGEVLPQLRFVHAHQELRGYLAWRVKLRTTTSRGPSS